MYQRGGTHFDQARSDERACRNQPGEGQLGTTGWSAVEALASQACRRLWLERRPVISGTSTSRRFALLARPGAGKTTLLEHLALTFARNTQRRIHAKAPRLLPILLYLRDIRGRIIENGGLDLSELVSVTLAERRNAPLDLTPPNEWFKDRLSAQNSRCLVMLDGLDEVASDAEREAVGRWIDQQMERYPEARFIVSSRPQGYLSAECQHVDVVLEALPFSHREVRNFVSNWFLQNEIRDQGRKDHGVVMNAEDKSRRLLQEIAKSDVLSELSINPLLLTMITTVLHSQGAVPESRVALYKEICEVMLVRRQRAKGLEVSLNSLRKQALLQRLALNLMLANTRSFDLQQAAGWLAESLTAVAGPDASLQDFLEGIARGSGLLVERERSLYEFSHKSLQEYLAATEIKETQRGALLIEHLAESWWEETIRLYASQTDTTELIQAALADPSVPKLMLAYDCAIEGLSTPPEMRKALLAKLETDLESEHAEEARLAAKVTLSQRLRSLIRIDEGVQIDGALVSCAEYQLFVDEQPAYAPLHWSHAHFLKRHAREPVTGLWPDAAEKYCEWLSAERPGKRYRLPTAEESASHPLLDNHDTRRTRALGYWSSTAVGASETDWVWTYIRRSDALALLTLAQSVVETIEPEQLISIAAERIPAPAQLVRKTTELRLSGTEQWPQVDYAIAWLYASGIEADSPLVRFLTLIVVCDAARSVALTIAESLGRDLALARYLADDLAAAEALAREVASMIDATSLGRDANLELDLDPDLGRALDADSPLSIQDRNTDQPRARVLVHANALARTVLWARTRTRVLAGVLARHLARGPAQTLADTLANALVPDQHFGAELNPLLDAAALRQAAPLTLDGALTTAHNRRLYGCRELIESAQRLVKSWGNPLTQRTPGTTLPMSALAFVLDAAAAHAQHSLRILKGAATSRELRNGLKLGKSACASVTEYYRLRRHSIAELQPWARLYAARDEQQHPGWEGLRLVCVHEAAREAKVELRKP